MVHGASDLQYQCLDARHNPSEFIKRCERSCFAEPSAEESTNVNDAQLAQSRLQGGHPSPKIPLSSPLFLDIQLFRFLDLHKIMLTWLIYCR